jgi:hypothetical protein
MSERNPEDVVDARALIGDAQFPELEPAMPGSCARP